MEKCPNCENNFNGNYCNNCGQKRIKGAMTIKMVLSDFVNSVFLFDSTLYKTLVGLLFRPGDFTRCFLEGKRNKYLPPFQFFLLFMTVYLLVLNYFGESFFEYINKGLLIESDQISKVEIIETFVRKNLNILYFILTPIIALFIRQFYRKIKFNFAETLIFSVYTMGIVFFLSTIIILIGQINNNVFALKTLITFGYLLYAIVQFTNSKNILGIFKALMTIILSYLMYVFVILIFASFYAHVFMIN